MLNSLLGWVFNNLLGLAAGGGVIAAVLLLALFWFAKPTFDAVVSFFAPVLKVLGTVVSDIVDRIWNASGKEILIVGFAIWFAFLGGKYQGEQVGYQAGYNTSQSKFLADLRKRYKLIERK